MCGGGGGGPETPEATKADVAEHKFNVTRAKMFGDVYLPLEQEAVDQAFDANLETQERNSLRGRANADVMQSEAEFAQSFAPSVGQGTGQVTLRDATESSAGAQAQAFKNADAQAQERTTQRQLNVVRTGESKASTTLNGLKAQSQIAADAAINRMKNKAIERNSKMQAINTLASSAVNAYGAYKAGQPTQQPQEGGYQSPFSTDAQGNANYAGSGGPRRGGLRG